MTRKDDRKNGFTGCCGWDFPGPMGISKEMSEMMQRCCGEDGSFDCSKMMEMFKDEDGTFNVSRMMEIFNQVTSKK